MIVEIEAKLCPTVVAQKDEYRHELGTESKRDRDEIPMIPVQSDKALPYAAIVTACPLIPAIVLTMI